MGLGGINNPQSDWEHLNNYKKSKKAAEKKSVTFDINQQTVKITQSNISEVTQGLAEIAYSLGETDDEEKFKEEMSEDILEALKIVKARRDKKKG